MLPNVTGLLTHKTEPIVMLQTKNHTGSIDLQTESLLGKIYTVSVHEDLEFLDNHLWSGLRQAALGLVFVSSPF